jgi:two-component system alkaline phosphatase synthesis response regulator PhoP
MSSHNCILVVDDEVDIREFICYNLTREGYCVHTAADGVEALRIAEEVRPQLILLDMMMPVMDGGQTCRALRLHPLLKDTMVVFLSAVCDEDCKGAAYEAGADDYITKPVSMRVLCSRVNAIMKRYAEPSASISLDEKRRALKTSEGEVVLPRKEFEILRLLCSEPERVFTREEIFRSIWGEEVVVGDRTLDVHIRRLRRKVGDERIVTVKGVGFLYKG